MARVLPLIHALALFRYGITGEGGRALHNIWGMHSAPEMAALSLVVLGLYTVAAVAGRAAAFRPSGAKLTNGDGASESDCWR